MSRTIYIFAIHMAYFCFIAGSLFRLVSYPLRQLLMIAFFKYSVWEFLSAGIGLILSFTVFVLPMAVTGQLILSLY